MSRQSVLMACTHTYDGPVQVGSQHLARQFIEHGSKLAYFSAPITLLHLLQVQNPSVRSRMARAFRQPVQHHHGRLLSFIPFSLLAPDGRPGLRNQTVCRRWALTAFPKPWKQVRRYGFGKIDLLYIDNISYGFWLDKISYSRSVFRVTDHHERFPGWEGHATPIASRIASKADVVLYAAKELETYVADLGARNAVFFPNGVDYEQFSNPPGKPSSRTGHLLRSIEGPIILYTGVIDERVDLKLLLDLSHAFPKASFVLVGPVRCRLPKIMTPRNLHFLGPMPHNQLPIFMHSAKIGIIPFVLQNSNERLKGIRPLKLLEYMAAGLPVVSTRWKELELMESPALLCSSKDEFVASIDTVLSRGWDALMSKEYAKLHDWSRRYTHLMRVLET